ncbi:MAG: copper amine oxidase [Firmicutes bacterium]|nr:copper amine oxidase [Bacillota bacterium]
MQQYFTGFIFFLTLFLCTSVTGVAFGADSVGLEIGSKWARVNGQQHELQVAPRVIKDKTFIPLRFIVEAFEAEVTWSNETKEIIVRGEDKIIIMGLGKTTATINGMLRDIDGALVIKDGNTLVPLRFLAETMRYKVNFMPETKEIHIEKLPPPLPPNKKPVADFTVNKEIVAQGETVTYEDKSHDPDGQKLVDRKWTGNKRAFFAPGEHEVTLRVKDSEGAWSETLTKVIKVTDEIKMDKFEYNLYNPVPGEPLDISHISVLDLKEIDPAVSMNREQVMVSNSPEIIREDGILYSDVLEGEHRLYYHHINGAKETKKVYLLAVNQGEKPVRLTVQKHGIAGPADPMAVGRAAAYRFMKYVPGESRFLELQPGEKVVLNKGLSDTVTPGNTVHGIFNINARDELQFIVLTVKDQKALDNYASLSTLPRDDNHIRGTFSRGNRFLSVNLRDNEPARLVVADGEDDSFLRGKDDRLVSKNKGNYGLIYRIKISSKHRVGVLFSPRGGVFAGAGEWDQQAFYLPNSGILKPKDGAMIGVVEAGKEKVLEFIPPAGSYLPVNLVFIPF